MKLGDTPDHSKNLCHTCENATILRGHSESQNLIYCHEVYFGPKTHGMVPYPIAECSSYRERQALTLSEMEKIAYVLENKDGKYGFRRLTREERNDHSYGY